MQECEDGGAEGGVPGVEIAGLQYHFRFGICGDKFRGEVDAGIVYYSLIMEEIPRSPLRVKMLLWRKLASYANFQRALC